MQVNFYSLSKSSHNYLNFSCRLAIKAWRQGFNIFILCNKQEQHELDILLWSFSKYSFIPHDPIEKNPNSPILLSTVEPSTKNKGALINLSHSIPIEIKQFSRIFEVIRSEQDNIKYARLKYAKYKKINSILNHYKI